MVRVFAIRQKTAITLTVPHVGLDATTSLVATLLWERTLSGLVPPALD